MRNGKNNFGGPLVSRFQKMMTSCSTQELHVQTYLRQIRSPGGGKFSPMSNPGGMPGGKGNRQNWITHKQ